METPTTGGYEFNAEENAIINATGLRAKTWGVLTLVAAVLLGTAGILAAVSTEGFGAVAGVIYALLALIPIFIGLNFVRAGNALGAVVTTRGNDIDHLMGSLQNLSNAFLIQIVATVLWFVAFLVGIAAAVALPAFLQAQ